MHCAQLTDFVDYLTFPKVESLWTEPNYIIVLQYLVLERLLLERSNSNIFGTELYWSPPIITLIVTIGAMLQSYHIPLLIGTYYNVTIGAITFYASFYRN